jgi:glucose-1-phosphate cytidylyltransferase
MIPMQTIILAGGQSTRLHSDRPKALSEVGGRAIIDHLIEALAKQQCRHISIALGSSQKAFAGHFNLPVQALDQSAAFRTVKVLDHDVELRLLETGDDCDTGGRLGRMRSMLPERFMLCWCDALWDVDVRKMLDTHAESKALVTLLAVHPPGRFGRLVMEKTRVTGFCEKPLASDEWINGGVFIMEPELLNLIDGDACSLERDVLPQLAQQGQLSAFRHEGFWHCMDTPADQLSLDQAIRSGILG